MASLGGYFTCLCRRLWLLTTKSKAIVTNITRDTGDDVIHTPALQPKRLAQARRPLTGLGVLVLRVGEREVGVGAAGQARTAARPCAPAPQSHGVLRGQHGVGLHVGIRAGAHGVATVGEADVCAVQGPMRRCHLAQTQLTKGEVGSWEETGELG